MDFMTSILALFFWCCTLLDLLLNFIIEDTCDHLSFIPAIHHSFLQFTIHSCNSPFISAIHHSFLQFTSHSNNALHIFYIGYQNGIQSRWFDRRPRSCGVHGWIIGSNFLLRLWKHTLFHMFWSLHRHILEDRLHLRSHYLPWKLPAVFLVRKHYICCITSHHITSHHITSHHITLHHIASHNIASRYNIIYFCMTTYQSHHNGWIS